MIRFKDYFHFSSKEVQKIFQSALRKTYYRGLTLLQEINPNRTFGKLLIITPRASGKAHERNLLRRRLKSIFYEEKLYTIPVTTIIIANKKSRSIEFNSLRLFLLDAIKGAS